MSKFQIALIGCGTWGASHAMLYHEDPRVELTGVCDIVESKALALADQVGLSHERVFTDYKEMLDKVPCDAVAIVTPDFAHREYAVACANAGKHMIIEKPLATTKEDADAIMEAIERNHVRAMVDFHNRWSPPFALMKEEIEHGSIGQPYSAYIRLNDQKWVPTDMLKWSAKSSVLWFLGSHATDTLRWLFNSEVDTVYTVSREGILKGEGVDSVDMYQSIYTFKNGCIAQVEDGWITPNGGPNVNDFKCSIMGTEGMYQLDLSSHSMIQRYGKDKTAVPDVLVNNFVRDTATGFAYQSIRHFVDAMINGYDFYVSLKDAYNVTMTVLAVLEAAKSGQPVKVTGLME